MCIIITLLGKVPVVVHVETSSLKWSRNSIVVARGSAFHLCISYE